MVGRIEDPRVQELLQKIRSSGKQLKDYCGCSPLSGIKTGMNNAFIVDDQTRKELVKQHSQCRSLMRPLLRGRDMERYRCRKSGLYMICIPSSENQDWPWSQSGRKAEQVFKQTYPSLAGHLSQFKEDLIKRQDLGRFWWELRSCDYWADFDSPKMVWQEMAWFTRFSVDRGKQIVLNTAYVLPSTDQLLSCFLNSPLAWWYMWRTAQHGKDEVLRLIRDYTEQFPIPEPDQETKGQLEQVAALLVKHGDSMNEFEQEALRRFRR